MRARAVFLIFYHERTGNRAPTRSFARSLLIPYSSRSEIGNLELISRVSLRSSQSLPARTGRGVRETGNSRAATDVGGSVKGTQRERERESRSLLRSSRTALCAIERKKKRRCQIPRIRPVRFFRHRHAVTSRCLLGIIERTLDANSIRHSAFVPN